MKNYLESSLIVRWLTAAARWLDSQWDKSRVSRLFRSRGLAAPGGFLGRLVHKLHLYWCALFRALRLDRAFEGSVFRRTGFWVCLAAFSAPLLPTMVVLGLVLLALGSLMVSFGCEPERRIARSRVGRWTAALTVVYLFSALTSISHENNLEVGMLIVAFMAFSLAVLNCAEQKENTEMLVRAVVASGFLVAAIGILQQIVGVDDTGKWFDAETFEYIELRVYSTLDNPNVLSEYLLLVIPLSLVTVLTAKTRRGRAAALLCAVSMLVCMILTQSRGGWLGLLVCLALMLVLLDRRFIVLGFVALLALLAMMPKGIIERFMSLASAQSDSSNHYRYSIWMGTLGMLKDYWVTGVGLDAFRLVYPSYSYSAAISQHAHNLYLQITCDCGIVGITVFLALIVSFLRSVGAAIGTAGRRGERDQRLRLIAIISGVVGFLVQGIAEYSFYNYRVMLMFWIMVGLGTAIAKESEEDA